MRRRSVQTFGLVCADIHPRLEAANVSFSIAVALCLALGAMVTPFPGVGLFAVRAATVSNPGKPNLFNPALDSKSIRHPLSQSQALYAATPSNTNTLSAMDCKSTAFAMQPAALGLSPTSASTFTSSDGRLSVSVPAGAVSSSQVAQDGGATSLLIRQIAPASGSNAGGSGEVSLGSYLLQVTTASGQLATHGLLQPATLTLNYNAGDSALDLGNAFVVFNSTVPPCINVDPSSVVLSAPNKTGSQPRTSNTSPKALRTSVGKLATSRTALNPSGSSLSTSTLLSSPSTSVSWGTNSPVATFGKPQPFEVDLSGASLTTGYPIDVPAGPKGFKPPLTLAYTSADVNDQHNPQGAASWVGEGWTMSLGAISWAEHDVAESGGTHWQDSWELSDPYGTAATLIPPTTSTATYNEDSGNPITASPVQWHTAPESYTKVFSYQSTLSIGTGNPTPPCFRVFLKNGIMEEFGCTTDSLEFYPGTNSKPYISSWLLDLITEPDGNQIHISYQQDSVTGSGGLVYPRDAVLSSIQWDSPTCYSVSTACTSSGNPPNKWAPQMQVSFTATHALDTAHTAGSNCGSGSGTLRCDDPTDLSGSGGLAAPIVQSDFILEDILVQIYDGTPAAWNTLRDYRLGYDQSAPAASFTDPVTGKAESAAGKLTLNRITVLGDDGSTSLPVTNFTYTSQTEYYEDSLGFPTPTNNCGPSWNTGYTPHNRGCVLWSQSYAGNSYYLSTASNGIGLAQSFSWQNLRDEMHSVTSGGNPADPMYCTNAENGVSGYSGGNVYPCDMTDDETWSRIGILTMQNSLIRLTQSGQGGTQTSTPVNGTYSYQFWGVYPLAAQECPDCVAGFSWGNQYDNDFLDFYNGNFMGMWQANVTHPDNSNELHKFYSTEGWGGWTTAGQNGLTLTCPASPPDVCHIDPYWDVANQNTYPGEANALHGHEYELDQRKADGTTVLQSVVTQYTAVCTPLWIGSFSPNVSGYTNNNWGGNLVSPLDLGNPMVACDVQATQVDNKAVDGAGGTVPDQTEAYLYETGSRPCSSCYGRLTKVTTSSNDGSANGNPTTIVDTTAYIWNDAITTTSTSATGSYLIDFPAFKDVEDSSGNRYQCTYLYYDPLTGYTAGQANTGANSNLKWGDLIRQDRWTNCGSAPSFSPTGQISTTYGYANGTYPYGNLWWSNDADSYAGVSGHTGCIVHSVAHSTCTAWDSYFQALPTTDSNALTQTTTNIYQAPASATAAAGFGLWPTSISDVNNQSTSYTYDALGRVIDTTLPAETSSLGYTTQMVYDVWCSGTAAQSPCAEIDKTQVLSGTTTAVYRAFYDGLGHLAETRSPAPGGHDVVQYYFYDPSGRQVFTSIPYFVTAYTGAAGSAAYSIPDSTVSGTCIGSSSCTAPGYDGLGRVTQVTDPLSETTATNYSVVCNPAGTGDSACYERTMTTDPLSHQSGVLADAMGRTNYEQRYTGNSTSTYALYATSKYTYDYLSDVTQILEPDGSSKITNSYDMTGRKTGMTDPDRGTETYAYDQDGNLTQSTDARGSAGTIYAGFDGIDRPIWRNNTNTPTGAYDTYTYDSTANGNVGVGRLTGETFSGAGLSGTYAYVYDVRGEPTSFTLTVGTSSYPVTNMTYNDAGQLLTQTYPDGDVVTNAYNGNQGWLGGVSTQAGSVIGSIGYSGTGGAAGQMTSGTLIGTYSLTDTYDALARATEIKAIRNSDGSTQVDQARTFDASGNVSTANTTLAAGTDDQAFCYDEQNRLIAAASSGTVPCQTFSAGTLTAANYNQAFGYDNMGRLTSGPLGTYAYGDSAHVHGTTAIGSSYTAAYDAAGNMTCRAPSSSSTCSGTQTGAQLAYNNEGQLSNWQNQPSSPTSTAAFLYDGKGNRVAQQTTSGGSTTTTVYVGNLEEDATTGSTTTKTSYYYANGTRIAMAVSGTLYAIVTDGLGSTNVVLDGSGNLSGAALYAPYGRARYATGNTSLTDYGFTGQHADSTSGLEYYGARYYDRSAGQFTSADTIVPADGFDVWGLSRYAYVEGNPVIRTDPTGHCITLACWLDVNSDDGTMHLIPGVDKPKANPAAQTATTPISKKTPNANKKNAPIDPGAGPYLGGACSCSAAVAFAEWYIRNFPFGGAAAIDMQAREAVGPNASINVYGLALAERIQTFADLSVSIGNPRDDDSQLGAIGKQTRQVLEQAQYDQASNAGGSLRVVDFLNLACGPTAAGSQGGGGHALHS